jgi:hypothetical protein
MRTIHAKSRYISMCIYVSRHPGPPKRAISQQPFKMRYHSVASTPKPQQTTPISLQTYNLRATLLHLLYRYSAKILNGNTTHGFDGQTNPRSNPLNFGPSGPATYLASPKIDGSPGGWSSPHLPLNSNQATGTSAVDGVKTPVLGVYV